MCYVESPPPICETEDFDVEQINPALQTITGLYDQALLCDECFMKIWRQRLVSPFLIRSNWTDYRVSTFDTMQKNCSTTMVYSTSAATLFVGTQDTTMTPTPTSGIPPQTTDIPITVACNGQTLQPLSKQYGCGELSDTYHVATGDLLVATNNDNCQFSQAVCLPLGCTTKTISSYGQTCSGLARSISNLTNNVTTEQFFGWNQNILGSCDSLAMGQRVCVRYVRPPSLVSHGLYSQSPWRSLGFQHHYCRTHFCRSVLHNRNTGMAYSVGFGCELRALS
jgi:hypothetical protein